MACKQIQTNDQIQNTTQTNYQTLRLNPVTENHIQKSNQETEDQIHT